MNSKTFAQFVKLAAHLLALVCVGLTAYMIGSDSWHKWN